MKQPISDIGGWQKAGKLDDFLLSRTNSSIVCQRPVPVIDDVLIVGRMYDEFSIDDGPIVERSCLARIVDLTMNCDARRFVHRPGLPRLGYMGCSLVDRCGRC